MPSEPLRYRARVARAEPAGALVLFHGRGADEHDLAGLFDVLDPEQRLACFSPRGPLAMPPGGAHWYVVESIGYPDAATFLDTYARAAAWLDALPALSGVPIERTVIGGFSQGCVMSYALGLGEGRPSPAGIIGLSGFVPTVEGFRLDLDRPGLPIAIGHGTLDPIIGVEWGRAARDQLGSAGLRVLYREAQMPHTIDPAFVAELRSWIADLLSTAR
jgi:phospholipase/carboxylesterase